VAPTLRVTPGSRKTGATALAGGIVAASAASGPSGIARRLAFVAAVCTVALTTVAYATGNHPVWAAIAMAAVALGTSLLAAAVPIGGALGFLLSLAYMLVATLSRVSSLHESVSVGWAAAHIAVGCLAGLIVAAIGTSPT
jgi:hypothetical protein